MLDKQLDLAPDFTNHTVGANTPGGPGGDPGEGPGAEPGESSASMGSV